jgi:hypothetical protein
MKKITLLLLVLILSACSLTSSTEFRRNQTKWENANITHYGFQLSVGCFCPVSGLMPMTVEVQDGEVVSISDVNGDDYPTTDPMSEFILKYATIDRLFSELGSASVRGADKLSVTYDSTYGFPTDITIDFIELAVDDELYLSISGFEPLP